MTQSDIQNNRVMACRLARRTSDDFSETYGDSSLDSIAPFESDEIILGRRVGSGAFAGVYQIKDFSLRANESKKILGVSIGGSYTGEQVLVIDKRWPLQIRGVIKRGLSKDLSDRPTMKEVCASLNEYFTSAAQDSEVENTRTSRRTSRGGRRSQSVILPPSSPKLGSSMTAIRGRRRSSFDTENTFEDLLEEVDHRGQ